MSTLSDIDKINDIVKMVTTMASLKIPTEGLKTLNEMKQRVKETLRLSEKKSSWTAKEAFSVLTEAKKEDEKKRATLLHFYEHSELCLNKMDEKVHALLEKNIGNLKDKIASHKKSLQQKEYIVLVAGETSSGKSTLLNLILGEQLLPYSVLSTTSTICELRYGDTPKLVAHLKDKKSGDTTRTVPLEKPSKASKQTYLKQISTFVHLKTDREKGSEYEKVELFWPHNLLKENVVIVDSPGIGESPIMDDIVKKYLPEAFAFIYVINSENAGGIQRDRVEKLIEHARQVSLDKQRESSSNCALFVCNKWDQVPSEETNEVKNFIVSKLTQCWPSLDPESQIIYMSAKAASEAQKLGVVTEEFGELMNGIKSMVLKSIEARLQIQWRWLDYLLARMAIHTKAFIRNSSEDRKNVITKMMFITDRLQSIERQQGTLSKELQTYLENKTDDAVSALSRYLKSADVMGKFTSWTLDDVPNTEASWEVTKNYIQKALMKRLHETIKEWEEKNHVFSKARSSLIEYFQKRFSYVEGKLRALEGSVLAEGGTNSASDPLASDNFSVAEKVVIGVTSPIWVPVGLVVLVVSVPVVGAIAVKEKLEDWSKTRKYDKDKCAFMAKASQDFLKEAAEEQQLKSFVEEQLKEAQNFLKQVLDRIPQLIEEDKMLCQKLRDENRCKKEIEMFYKPLHEESVKLRDKMALFGIKEVRTMDISCDDLEWQDDAPLGIGAFAAVYKGVLKIQGEAQSVGVALKVWNEELNDATAIGFHAEAEMLRKLNYPSIVKFYGAALRKEGNQLRAILVMELCKGNLRNHIFRDRSNVPGVSTTATTAAKNVIGWAKDIADALDYIHQQGIIHSDLKLENVLLSQENLAKVAGVFKEAKAITGTMTGTPMYLAPEVIMSKMYDYKADVYSFGIMLWEMWYGRRALSNVRGNVNEFFEKVVEGTRPIHVKGFNKPPAGLHDLMQRCWQEKPDNRPDAAKCHTELTELYKKELGTCSVVSSEGGALKKNDVELTWPPNAVDEPVTIKLTLQEPSKYYRMIFRSGLENDLIFAQSVINCHPNGQTFNKSLTLRITLDKYMDQFKNLFVLHGRETERKDIIWEDVTEKSTFDSNKNAVCTEINGFSLIAVLLGSIWVTSKELVARLNFMSFRYTLSVLYKSNSPNYPFDEIALVFMSQDVYQEKHYREQDESVLTKLESDGFKQLGSTVQKETNHIYNRETLNVSIQLGQDYRLAINQEDSWKLTVESSVWWSTGHVIRLPLERSPTNAKILCGKILVQGQYGHRREDHFCQLDLCGYVKGFLGIQNLIYNLQPIAQRLGLSTETWRQVVSFWQDEEKQLEVILISWREKERDNPDPTFLRESIRDLEPEAYRVKERGQMHIRHLRKLATTIDRLKYKDRDMKKYLSNEIKYLCGSVFRDCCIEIATSEEDLEFVASTENHSDILVTHGKISQEVSKQYHEKIRSSSLESITENFLSIVPHLIQPIKEIFKDKNVPQVQNGMRGVADETTLARISSEMQDAVEKKNLFRLFTAVSNILECLCHSYNVGQSQIPDDVIRECSGSVMIIRMLHFLDKYFTTAGSDALRLRERLRIISIQLKDIMSDPSAFEGTFLSDFYNVTVSLVAFAKFDPSRFLRFELKDPDSSADIRGDDVLRYDKSKEIFSQLFWISKEFEEELQLEAIAYVHIGGKLRRIGAFESEITLPALTSKVIDKLSMASLPVVVKREYGFGESIRVTLYATQKENVCKALDYLKQELGEELVDPKKVKIASSRLKLRSFAKAGTVVKLRLIHKWGSETISLDSHDFIALADSSARGAIMPHVETAAEARQLAAIPGSSDESSFVMDPSHAEMVQRHLNEHRGKLEIHYHQSFMKGHVCVVGKNTNLTTQMPAAIADQRCLEAGPSTAPQRSLTAATTDEQEN